jgi:site-specific DNA-cytosine methylase
VTHGSLFSGIGLLDLGLQRAGLGAPAWQCEIDPFCRSVLSRHWPTTPRHDDVRTFTPPVRVKLVAGGFPCQPHSVAGARRGAADHRHLWPEYARVLRKVEPAAVLVENVPGLRTTELRNVLADLAAMGFDAEWVHYGAGALGAPHKRDRLWLAATHPDRVRVRHEPGWFSGQIRTAIEAQSRRDREVLDPDTLRDGCGTGRLDKGEAVGQDRLPPERRGADLIGRAIDVARRRGWSSDWLPGAAPRVDDGLPRGVVGARKRALGNAVVVACAELAGRALLAAHPDLVGR